MGQDSHRDARRAAEALSAVIEMPGGFVHRLGGVRLHDVAAQSRSGRPQASRNVADRELHSTLQFAADTVVIVTLGTLVGVAYHASAGKAYDSSFAFGFTGLTVAFLFAGIERLLATRRGLVLTTGFDRFRDVAQSWTLAFAALLFILFALKADGGMSRGAVLSFYLVSLPVIGIWRAVSAPALARIAHKTGCADRECIVIGDVGDRDLDGFVAELTSAGYPPPTIVECRARCDSATWPSEHKRLVTRTFAAARASRNGEIFLCAGEIPPDRLALIERALSVLPRAIYVVPEAQTASLVRCRPASIGSYVAVEVRREPLGRLERVIKRVMDVVIASCLLVFLMPALVLIAVLIKADSAGPVLFRQTRKGYRGKPFRIFKFRTMSVQEDGPVVRQASRDDPRVTRVGRFLRSSSLDELPQLLNVLLGHMSLVGPRPHAQAHDELYAGSIENYEVRQHVKPGMTGWAQINGLRGATQDISLMYRRIEYDLWYAANASLMFDCEILLRTIFEVFRHRNAY